MHRTLVALALVTGCGDKEKVLGPTDQGQLLSTLESLAAFGEKHAGSPEGAQAAQYIQQRFEALRLSDVHLESFTFPRWELMSKSMTISIDGAQSTPGFDVFEASGNGVVDGEIVNVETATDGELAGKDLTGKIALVIRDPSFHRSRQYQNVVKAHAAAMLYLSIAPTNLRQVGSTRFDWESAGPIPAVTVGADDGAVIRDAVIAGKTVRAKIDVAVKSSPGTGSNVVATIPGELPETIVLGAHYDTWFAGSADNGGGVAELLAVADRRKQHPKPRYTLVFVAYDGEEIGLYGGYDYLRKHHVIAGDPIVAVLNFESPAANNPDIAGLVHSNQPALDDALQAAHLRQLYGVYAGLEVVAMLFGGIIPTDIQGVYRSGVPTVTTAVTNNYYHTTEDTPDKVDLQMLADSTDEFDAALDFIMKNDPSVYEVVDTSLWTTDVQTSTAAMFTVNATFADGNGGIGANAIATASILTDDFTLTAITTDATGHAQFQFPPSAIAAGSGNRFLHVTAGPTYPLVEKIIALP
jgi:Zn-dependent M28 family amino/carboxypeptidase